jgi:hypothetical protein
MVDTNLLSHRAPTFEGVGALFSPINSQQLMGENRALTPSKVGARCYSTFEPANSNFCMAIDVFVLQIMISSEKPRLNDIGNNRLVPGPGFSQGPNSLGKASALVE